jgi:hypothetical protein
VERHDGAAEDVADQQADDGPERIRAEDHRERAVDDRGDLGVGAEPERELAPGAAVALGARHHVNGSGFYG